MRLKHIGIAAMVAAGALVADGTWALAAHIEGSGQAARDSRSDADTDGTRSGRFDPGRFDPYTNGARTGRLDPYTDGLHRDPAEPSQIQRTT